jgi:hypothetical protein
LGLDNFYVSSDHKSNEIKFFSNKKILEIFCGTGNNYILTSIYKKKLLIKLKFTNLGEGCVYSFGFNSDGGKIIYRCLYPPKN